MSNFNPVKLLLSTMQYLVLGTHIYPDKIEYGYRNHVKNKTQFQHINELLDDVL